MKQYRGGRLRSLSKELKVDRVFSYDIINSFRCTTVEAGILIGILA